MAKKILVIDDDHQVVKTIGKLLKKAGYYVITSENGKEALSLIEKEEVDLIISDIRIPEMDGIEIIKSIRTYLQQNQRPSIPEILITGYASKEKYQDAIDLDVAAYINKPFDIKELLESVKGALNEG